MIVNQIARDEAHHATAVALPLDAMAVRKMTGVEMLVKAVATRAAGSWHYRGAVGTSSARADGSVGLSAMTPREGRTWTGSTRKLEAMGEVAPCRRISTPSRRVIRLLVAMVTRGARLAPRPFRARPFGAALSTVLVVAALVAPNFALAEERGGLPPEAVEVLSRFLGEWKTTTRIDQQDTAAVEKTGRATCRTTLGDRYFEFRSESTPAGQSELQIMTYDAGSSRYRQWVFDSDGYYHQADGRWESGSSTLRWTGERGGTAFVIEDRWITPDRLEWTLTRTDPDGRPRAAVAGALVRIKPR
jgi:hypothetical protein